MIYCNTLSLAYGKIFLSIIRGDTMANTLTLTRKIQLYPIGDKDEINRVYTFIRDGQYAQYQGLNLLMGQLVGKFYECNRDIKSEEFKEAQKNILKGSNPALDDIEFAKGVDSKSAITQKVKQDFSTALKNGLARGERTVTNYKRTYPLMTRGRDLKFTHNFSSHQDLIEHLMDSDLELSIHWVNKIKFKIVLGNNPNKSEGLRKELLNIFEENYKVQGSSIQIDGNKIILNLSMQIPKNNNELDENIVVGVDLGLAVPAMCALNNSQYIRKSIGSYDDFTRVRTQMQQQRKRLQHNIKYSKGGHGRKKKLAALEKYKKYESNFVQSYNHMISKSIIDFAIKHHAKYINIEDLSGYDSSKFVLRNWSYYQLQEYITYKADKEGIIVRKIKPHYTSQKCSKCGNIDKEQRDSQAHFKCAVCGYEENADFNASRNIAISEEFK